MATFREFMKALEEGVEKLAREMFDGLEADALADTKAFLGKTKKDLQRWTKLLAARQLTHQDFRDLVKAKAALAEMHALTQAGIVLTKLERFRTGLVDLVIDTAFKVYL